jgi:2,4-diketo-3-deoxy-L-fuconate hydrolase
VSAAWFRTAVVPVLAVLVVLAVAPASAQGLRLARYGAPGAEKPALVDAQGRLRDLSGHLADITPDVLGRLDTLAALDPATLPLVPGTPRLGVPVSGVRKIVAVGYNYRDHAAEMTRAPPAEPLLFTKAITALSGPYDDVVAPRGYHKLDYEAELVVVIGRRARYVDEADALAHVAGFAVGHDVSERAFQRERGGQYVKGKSADTFAPVGPWLVTPEAVDDVQALAIGSHVNGEARQDASTADMIFGVAGIVAYVSRFMTLEPGDLIFTGTPSGVGAGMDPPRWLQPGDVVEVHVEGLGSQRQTIRPPE